MTNLTQAAAVENFESIAQQLMVSAATEKAAAFAEKTIAAVRAKGAAWILQNAQELRVTFVPSKNTFPVADNRNYYIAAFQMAVLNK